VIVHGGGPDITCTVDRLGIDGELARGASHHAAGGAGRCIAMVLTGRVNKRIVGALIGGGRGCDRAVRRRWRLLRADLVEGGALGRVGRSRSTVRVPLLSAMLGLGHTLVISPISLGDDGEALNVNADDAAAAIAVALGAERARLRDGCGREYATEPVTCAGLDTGEAVCWYETGWRRRHGREADALP
jgi:acetylglutamate kinase